MFASLCISLFLLSAIVDAEDFTLLYTSGGPIRGRQVNTEKNVTGFVFLGIPYAEPPIGDRRYRPPVAHLPWKETIDARYFASSCLWNSSSTTNDPNLTVMSEDCLFMNVLTNKKCLVHGRCAVIYYIHGGGFTYDTPSLFSVEFLIENFLTEDRSVVFVMPGFRLGSFGFLNLSPHHNSSAAKNVAFLDIIEGLKWVQKEIAVFGGNPLKVTIMGHSSGGISSNMLTMSPLSKGLYNSAVSMSGGGINPRGKETNYKESVQLAVAAGCLDTNSSTLDEMDVEKVLLCLREIDAKKLLLLQRAIDDAGFSFGEGPCIDGAGGVFPTSVSELRRERHCERLLIGTTSQEMNNYRDIWDENGLNKNRLREGCSRAIDLEHLRKKVRPMLDCMREYSNPRRSPHVVDDVSFFVSSILSGEDVFNAGKTAYLYEFQYRFAGTAFNFSHVVPAWAHPQHTEDLVYVMGIHKGIFTPKDEIIRHKYSQLFVDFAKGTDMGGDNHKWTPLVPKMGNYFAIDFDENNEMPGMKVRYHRRAVKFWNETVYRHGGGIIDPVLQLSAQGNAYALRGSENDSAEGDGEWAATAIVTGSNFDDDYGYEGSEDGNPENDKNIDGAARWNTYFWMAVGALIIMAAALIGTCILFCYNYQKRREYERIV